MSITTPSDELCINTIRFLAVDAVQKANSGHPGMPMGAATMAYVLWHRFLKHNPEDPTWPDRDRFVLSAGHSSAMLYSLLYLTGYELSLKEIKKFRQWGSKTPGHPEHGLTPGVEVTTGPLGQGFANGVGMAIAERWLAGHYNRPGHEIINHYIYAIVSDGDMMEGVSSEAASLAGTLRLGKLIYLYDDNDISIEGDTDITFTEDVGQRFRAYGWHVIGPIDGMEAASVDSAIRAAQDEKSRPSLIICKTIIGYGSPNKAGTALAHGEPLGEEEVRLTKERLGWTYEKTFTVPEEVLAHFRQAVVLAFPGQALLGLVALVAAGGRMPLGLGELDDVDQGGHALFPHAPGGAPISFAKRRVVPPLDRVEVIAAGFAGLAPEAGERRGEIFLDDLVLVVHRDAVVVVPDRHQQRRAQHPGGVERLPEQAFGTAGVADGAEGDLIAVP